MQGTAADIIKLAMTSVDAWLQSESVQAVMIMQVHDELVFEVAEQEVDALEAGVRQLMEGAAQLDVPLVLNVGVRANWDQAHCASSSCRPAASPSLSKPLTASQPCPLWAENSSVFARGMSRSASCMALSALC